MQGLRGSRRDGWLGGRDGAGSTRRAPPSPLTFAPTRQRATNPKTDGLTTFITLASRGPAAGWPPTSVWAGCVPPEHQESSNNNSHLPLHFRRLVKLYSFISKLGCFLLISTIAVPTTLCRCHNNNKNKNSSTGLLKLLTL